MIKMLLLLCVMVGFESLVSEKFYLYDTDSPQDYPRLKFNCVTASNGHRDNTEFIREYCLRPINNDIANAWWSEGIPAPNDQKFSFEQLAQMNMSSRDLYSWTDVIALGEEYQEYLNNRNTRLGSKEVFLCSPPWFGLRCQYHLPLPKAESMSSKIWKALEARYSIKQTDHMIHHNCYTLLHCEHDGKPVCLHWSQVCDGKIDCIDGEEDEEPCFAMEINECEPNEYRCHNGQCIPNNFHDDVIVGCLDYSDLINEYNELRDELLPSSFFWRDKVCLADEKNLGCGDGECVSDLETCRNGNQPFLTTIIEPRGNLTTECWTAMVCLTKIKTTINEISCSQLIQIGYISNYLSSCDPLIQFPSKPILHHHVYLLYNRDHLITQSFHHMALPAYICFNPQLCEHLSPSFHHQHFACCNASEMGLNLSHLSLNWTSMMKIIRSHFYGCLLQLPKEEYRHHPSLYCCQNSSKCISKHRIVDGIIDCPYHDDEYAYALSCTVKHSHRFQCDNEKQCRSPSFYRPAICPSNLRNNLNELLFPRICNGFIDLKAQLISGRNHTDETDCELWPCTYTALRCDHFWNCPNGEDEIGCGLSHICPSHKLVCVSPINYTLTCLSRHQIKDGIMDCLGGNDEATVCRQNKIQPIQDAFACLNDTKCLSYSKLCDGIEDCRFGDDEIFCNQRTLLCIGNTHEYQTEVEKVICRIAIGLIMIPLFENSLAKSRKKSNDVIVSSHQSIPSQNFKQLIKQTFIFNETDVWYCHYGLSLVVRLTPSVYSTRCLCPSDSYGDRCQHQSQRVSVTLQRLATFSGDHLIVYFISLISYDHDHEELHSYHMNTQINILTSECFSNLGFSLLYRDRPKNISKDYFIKIDAFNQLDLTHMVSWRFPVPFLFLPVIPMVLFIRVPSRKSQMLSKCPLTCGSHGRCFKYLNNHEFFCRCDAGWNGKQCKQSVKCTDCGSTSLCLGEYNNRSICLCPIDKVGSRCLLDLATPEITRIFEICSVKYPYSSIGKLICRCPPLRFGLECQFLSRRVRISLHNITKASTIFIFQIENNKNADFYNSLQLREMLKLRIFQTFVILNYSIVPETLALRVDENYYLATHHENSTDRAPSFEVSDKHQCHKVEEIIPAAWIHLPSIQRVKYFHHLCQLQSHLKCFVGDGYFCQCSKMREAICLYLQEPGDCEEDLYCLNEARCIQDRLECPVRGFCICSDCFFGDQCQFYAKGLGLTLDDMLRYELQPSTPFHQQPISVKISAALTVTMFVTGLINTILTLLTFYPPGSRQVGVGIYLYASSITSLMTVTVLNLKFWFLSMTHIYPSVSHHFLRAGCLTIEPAVRLSLFTDSWLNASVAIERAITVFKGVNFNKQFSQRIARWMIWILPLFICISLVHEFIYRDLFYDSHEDRYWCIIEYGSVISSYTTFILTFHTLAPFSINILSAIYIIIGSIRRRVRVRNGQSYNRDARAQLKEHRHLIISPLILAALSSPRVILSLFNACVRTYRDPWLYLSGYYISFLPSVGVFIVFVMPSALYKEQLAKSVQSSQEWIRQKMNRICRRS